MTQSQIPIAIIGAGPSGLTLARLLELAGIKYKVFERDQSSIHDQRQTSSGTLDIHPKTGQKALAEAGLLEKFQSIARYGTETRIADEQGNVLALLAGKDTHDRPEIDRKDLRNLLLESIPDENIAWDCKVKLVQKDSDGTFSIHDENGAAHHGFRLIVGADGVWSKVRRLITTSESQYSGIHFFSSFITPASPSYNMANSFACQGNFLSFNQGRQVFMHYMGDGSYHLAVGMQLPQGLADKAVSSDSQTLWDSFLAERFTGWGQSLVDLIKFNNRPFRNWPVYFTPKESIPFKHVPGVALIGDAAHATVPGGDGVNNALFDSLELANRITQFGIGNLEEAVKQYEEDMLPRALKTISKGQWFKENMFEAEKAEDVLRAMGMRQSTENMIA